MKSIGFDTGPIISLVTNNLLWIVEPLKKQYGGRFFITPAVKRELIDKAFMTKRFEFEALQISQLIKKGIFEVIDNPKIHEMRSTLMRLANNSFKTRGRWLNIVSDAEIEVLAADAVLDAEATVVDERTARMMLENPPSLVKLFEKKLHCKIEFNKGNTLEFQKFLKDVQIIRSTELVTLAFRMGLLDDYLIERSNIVKNPRKRLLDAALWAVKVRGCSVSKAEIDKIISEEL
jgi:hypothetical protein